MKRMRLGVAWLSAAILMAALHEAAQRHARGAEAHYCLWSGQTEPAWRQELVALTDKLGPQLLGHQDDDTTFHIVMDAILPSAQHHNPATGELASSLAEGAAESGPAEARTENKRAAARWMKLAEQDYQQLALAGDVRAQLALAEIYDPNNDSAKLLAEDTGRSWRAEFAVKAEGWYLKAAQAGLPSAQVDLATFYVKNNQDRDILGNNVYDWISKAAHQGDGNAQGLLSDAYAMGTLPEHSLIMAYAWALVADKNGEPVVKMLREKDSKLSLSELRQAREIANELIKSLPTKGCYHIN